jgi:hypothetical protein
VGLWYYKSIQAEATTRSYAKTHNNFQRTQIRKRTIILTVLSGSKD